MGWPSPKGLAGQILKCNVMLVITKLPQLFEAAFSTSTGFSSDLPWSAGERRARGQQSIVLQRVRDRNTGEVPQKVGKNPREERSAQALCWGHRHYRPLQETSETALLCHFLKTSTGTRYVSRTLVTYISNRLRKSRRLWGPAQSNTGANWENSRLAWPPWFQDFHSSWKTFLIFWIFPHWVALLYLIRQFFSSFFQEFLVNVLS